MRTSVHAALREMRFESAGPAQKHDPCAVQIFPRSDDGRDADGARSGLVVGCPPENVTAAAYFLATSGSVASLPRVWLHRGSWLREARFPLAGSLGIFRQPACHD